MASSWATEGRRWRLHRRLAAPGPGNCSLVPGELRRRETRVRDTFFPPLCDPLWPHFHSKIDAICSRHVGVVSGVDRYFESDFNFCFPVF